MACLGTRAEPLGEGAQAGKGEGLTPLYDAIPTIAATRGGMIIIKRKIQVKMAEKISLYNTASSS